MLNVIKGGKPLPPLAPYYLSKGGRKSNDPLVPWPRYCSDCGSELVRVTTGSRIDAHTGEVSPRESMRCPKRATNGFMALFNMGHDSFPIVRMMDGTESWGLSCESWS